MDNRKLLVLVSSFVAVSWLGAGQVQAQENGGLAAEIDRIESEFELLKRKVDSLEMDREEDGITIGGAVRFQYVVTDYDDAQRSRGGDLDFDIFRLDFNGRMGDVILSAQYRWFEYMDAFRHAYFGYDFAEDWQGQVGMVIQPFGVMPYNSHSYFFSSNFYLGMEDNNGAGIRLRKRSSDWDLDFAFILNDELGGATGLVRSPADRYNYDVVGIRLPGEGIYDEPTQVAGENNTFMTRAARKWHWDDERMLELGVSLQYGRFNDGQENMGDRENLGLHAVYHTGPWEFHAQYATYDYTFDVATEGVVLGAYAYFDTVPESADIYTANIAYNLPVDIGPITHLQLYNNYSLVTNKRGFNDDTVMNVIGMSVTAGGMFTYVDLVTAKNQPFVNGAIGADGGSTNTRFNINFGYYF